MQQRIVEIASDGVHLSAFRGFMKISRQDEELGRVPFADIAAVVLRGHGSTLSVSLCIRLSDAGVPLVICGSNQSPSSLLWPVRGHYEQGRRMEAQAVASRPLLKRTWRDLIAAKIAAQAAVLEATTGADARLTRMAREVKSGDGDNLEAQAARRYWGALFGSDFLRDRQAEGINSALNYGYTVLRAGTARSILAVGLHPSLSIHHASRGDALRLADDLMEPFRPYLDFLVWRLAQGEPNMELTSEVKAHLASVLTLDLPGGGGVSPIQIWLDRLALSWAKTCLGEIGKLDLPGQPSPLELHA